MRTRLPVKVLLLLLALLSAGACADHSRTWVGGDVGLQDAPAETSDAVDDNGAQELGSPELVDAEVQAELGDLQEGDQDGYQGGISCTAGDPIIPGDQGIFGIIDPPGDRDYFLLQLDHPAYLIIRTKANPDGLAGMLDTVVSLYDQAGLTLLATSDDSLPELGADSELLFHAPEPGIYCLKVEDFTTWKDLGANGGMDYIYQLEVQDLGPGTPGVTFGQADAQPAPPSPKAFETRPFGWRSILLGHLSTLEKGLTFRLRPTSGSVFLELSLMPGGPGAPGANAHSGYGSTLRTDRVELRTTDGTVLARVNPLAGMDALWLPLGEEAGLPFGEDLDVWVLRQEEGVEGPNDFIAMKADLHAWWNQAEAANDTNGVATTAEPLLPNGDSWFITANLSPGGDLDLFSFQLEGPGRLEVGCLASRVGSGLRATEFAILDPVGAVLRSQAEETNKDLLWADYAWASGPSVEVTDPGLHLLRVSPGAQDGQVSSTFYQCGIHFLK